MRQRGAVATPRILAVMDTPTPPRPSSSDEAADARATKLLIWIGAAALAMLLAWIVIVLVAFM